ncbi:MAG: hypothetical protein PUC12_17615 [Clostridiales bacterium]|nr:hypothetical protein [Clostridiales bacterium]
MKGEYKKPQGFNLSDLWMECRSCWIVVIISIVVCVAVSLGTAAAHNKEQSNNPPVEQEVPYEFSEEQLKKIRMLEDYKKLYENQKRYDENAVLMKVDATNAVRDDLYFEVTGEDNITNVVNYYTQKLAGADYIKKLTDNFATDGDMYLNEIITVTNIAGVTNKSAFVVTIRHYDEEKCKKIVDFTKQYITECKMNNDYEITLLQEDFDRVIDSKVAEIQRSAWNTEAGYANAYYGNLKALTEEERDYFNGNTTHTVVTGGGQLYDMKERGVIGVVLGILLYVAIIFVKLCFNKKLLYSDRLHEIFGITEYCSFKKKGLDAFADKVGSTVSRQMPKDADKPKLLVVKRYQTAKSNRFVEQLEAVLDKRNVSHTVIASVDSTDMLKDVDGVLFVETVRKTSYDSVWDDLEFCAAEDKCVLGIVAL